MSTIPIGILRAVSWPFPSSYRPKLRKQLTWRDSIPLTLERETAAAPEPLKPVAPVVHHYTHRNLGQQLERGPVQKIQTNLTENELRFWAGSYLGGNWSGCRCCGATILSSFIQPPSEAAKKRKEHQRAESNACTQTLLRVYKELRDLSVCAICDNDVKETRWGVPLHAACREKFKTRLNLGFYFTQFLHEIRDQGGTK